jgi:hypothetical protein
MTFKNMSCIENLLLSSKEKELIMNKGIRIIFLNFFVNCLYIYSYVYTLFGPSLFPVPCPSLTPHIHPAHFQAEPVLPSSPV